MPSLFYSWNQSGSLFGKRSNFQEFTAFSDSFLFILEETFLPNS
jgi:hypothetical protein